MDNKKKLVFLFPSTIFSGHEKMALRILEEAPAGIQILCILNKALISKFTQGNEAISYHSRLSLIRSLFYLRIKYSQLSIFLVAGSPYGFIFEKLIMKFFFIEIVEYVPVPELRVIRDRFHHRFMPIINNLLISKRVLIDGWQIPYSSVKRCMVIKNII